MTKKGHKTGSKRRVQTRTPQGTFSTKLTRKQKAFADGLLNNPKASATAITKQTYDVSDDGTARNIASKNLANANILKYLEAYKDRAQERITELVESEREDIALRASQDTLDRTVGKPTQKTEVQSTGVTIHLDLTG